MFGLNVRSSFSHFLIFCVVWDYRIMESIAAFYGSYAQHLNTLSFRMNLLRFCLPFEIYPMKLLENITDIQKIEHHKDKLWDLAPRRALVIDVLMPATLDGIDVFLMFCLVPPRDGCSSWKVCFDLPSLLTVWGVYDSTIDPLRQVGCVIAKHHPYETYIGNLNHNVLCLLDVLCTEKTHFLADVPLMHLPAQSELRRCSGAMLCKDFHLANFLRIYNKPYDVQALSHDPKLYPASWRPNMKTSNEEIHRVMEWKSMGLLVLTQDFSHHLSCYIHPVVLHRMADAFKDFYDDVGENVQLEQIQSMIWPAFSFLQNSGDLSLYTHHDWISVDHILNIVLNSPMLMRSFFHPIEKPFNVYQLRRGFKTGIIDQFQRHRISGIMLVNSFDPIDTPLHQVIIQQPQIHGARKCYLRYQPTESVLYKPLLPPMDTRHLSLLGIVNIEDQSNYLYGTLHFDGQFVLHPGSKFYHRHHADSKDWRHFHYQLNQRELIQIKPDQYFHVKQPIIFECLRDACEYFNLRRKLSWMVRLGLCHDISLVNYLETHTLCLL